MVFIFHLKSEKNQRKHIKTSRAIKQKLMVMTTGPGGFQIAVKALRPNRDLSVVSSEGFIHNRPLIAATTCN